jgi:flagellar motor component MotA
MSMNTKSNNYRATTTIQPFELLLRELRIVGSTALLVTALGFYVAFGIAMPSRRIAKKSAQDEANLAKVIAAMMLHHR